MGSFCCKSVQLTSKRNFLLSSKALLPLISSVEIRLLEQKEMLALKATNLQHSISHSLGTHLHQVRLRGSFWI